MDSYSAIGSCNRASEVKQRVKSKIFKKKIDKKGGKSTSHFMPCFLGIVVRGEEGVQAVILCLLAAM